MPESSQALQPWEQREKSMCAGKGTKAPKRNTVLNLAGKLTATLRGGCFLKYEASSLCSVFHSWRWSSLKDGGVVFVCISSNTLAQGKPEINPWEWKKLTGSTGSRFHTRIQFQVLWSFFYSMMDTSDRIKGVRMNKQIAETDPSPFLNILSFSDNENYSRSLGDRGLMLKSEVRAEEPDSGTLGSGHRRWGGCRWEEGRGGEAWMWGDRPS